MTDSCHHCPLCLFSKVVGIYNKGSNSVVAVLNEIILGQFSVLFRSASGYHAEFVTFCMSVGI